MADKTVKTSFAMLETADWPGIIRLIRAEEMRRIGAFRRWMSDDRIPRKQERIEKTAAAMRDRNKGNIARSRAAKLRPRSPNGQRFA